MNDPCDDKVTAAYMAGVIEGASSQPASSTEAAEEQIALLAKTKAETDKKIEELNKATEASEKALAEQLKKIEAEKELLAKAKEAADAQAVNAEEAKREVEEAKREAEAAQQTAKNAQERAKAEKREAEDAKVVLEQEKAEIIALQTKTQTEAVATLEREKKELTTANKEAEAALAEQKAANTKLVAAVAAAQKAAAQAKDAQAAAAAAKEEAGAALAKANKDAQAAVAAAKEEATQAAEKKAKEAVEAAQVEVQQAKEAEAAAKKERDAAKADAQAAQASAEEAAQGGVDKVRAAEQAVKDAQNKADQAAREKIEQATKAAGEKTEQAVEAAQAEVKQAKEAEAAAKKERDAAKAAAQAAQASAKEAVQGEVDKVRAAEQAVKAAQDKADRYVAAAEKEKNEAVRVMKQYEEEAKRILISLTAKQTVAGVIDDAFKGAVGKLDLGDADSSEDSSSDSSEDSSSDSESDDDDNSESPSNNGFEDRGELKMPGTTSTYDPNSNPDSDDDDGVSPKRVQPKVWSEKVLEGISKQSLEIQKRDEQLKAQAHTMKQQKDSLDIFMQQQKNTDTIDATKKATERSANKKLSEQLLQKSDQNKKLSTKVSEIEKEKSTLAEQYEEMRVKLQNQMNELIKEKKLRKETIKSQKKEITAKETAISELETSLTNIKENNDKTATQNQKLLEENSKLNKAIYNRDNILTSIRELVEVKSNEDLIDELTKVKGIIDEANRDGADLTFETLPDYIKKYRLLQRERLLNEKPDMKKLESLNQKLTRFAEYLAGKIFFNTQFTKIIPAGMIEDLANTVTIRNALLAYVNRKNQGAQMNKAKTTSNAELLIEYYSANYDKFIEHLELICTQTIAFGATWYYANQYSEFINYMIKFGDTLLNKNKLFTDTQHLTDARIRLNESTNLGKLIEKNNFLKQQLANVDFKDTSILGNTDVIKGNLKRQIQGNNLLIKKLANGISLNKKELEQINAQIKSKAEGLPVASSAIPVDEIPVANSREDKPIQGIKLLAKKKRIPSREGFVRVRF